MVEHRKETRTSESINILIKVVAAFKLECKNEQLCKIEKINMDVYKLFKF